MYGLDTCSTVDRLDDEFLRDLVEKGYLAAVPVDPGAKGAEPTSYVLVEGAVGCLRHGFIEPPAGLPATTPAREQFRAAGVTDPELLARASGEDPTFWAGRATWNRVQGLWGIWSLVGFAGLIVIVVRLVRWWPRVAGSGAALVLLSVGTSAGFYAATGFGLLAVAATWACVVTAGFAVRAGSLDALGGGALSDEQEAALDAEVRQHRRGAVIAALALVPVVPGLVVEVAGGRPGAAFAVVAAVAVALAGGVLWAACGMVSRASFPARPGLFPWTVLALAMPGGIWLMAMAEGALGEGGMGVEVWVMQAVPSAVLLGRYAFSALILPAIARALRLDAEGRVRGKVLRRHGLSAHPSRGTF